MNKSEQIMELVREGKTFQEIVNSGQKEKFVQITLGKNGYDWKTMKPKMTVGIDPAKEGSETTVVTNITNGEIVESKTIEEVKPPLFDDEPPVEESPEIDQQMNQMETQANAKMLAQAMAIVMQDPGAFLQLMGDKEVTPSGIRKKVEKCSRHPDIDVKPGENCEECLSRSHAHERMMNTRDYVIPCPKCQNALRQRNGGTIKKLPTPGIYSCGNCEVTYNGKGEMTTWESGQDKKYFDKAQKAGLF